MNWIILWSNMVHALETTVRFIFCLWSCYAQKSQNFLGKIQKTQLKLEHSTTAQPVVQNSYLWWKISNANLTIRTIREITKDTRHWSFERMRYFTTRKRADFLPESQSNVLKRLAYSSVLNPIENICALVKKTIATTRDLLKKFRRGRVREVWS